MDLSVNILIKAQTFLNINNIELQSIMDIVNLRTIKFSNYLTPQDVFEMTF